jgi:hypothetical protein
LAYHFSGHPDKGLEDAKRAIALRPGWTPALSVVVLCSMAMADQEQARSAVLDLKAHGEPKGDLLILIIKYNPSWGEAIESAVAAAEAAAKRDAPS